MCQCLFEKKKKSERNEMSKGAWSSMTQAISSHTQCFLKAKVQHLRQSAVFHILSACWLSKPNPSYPIMKDKVWLEVTSPRYERHSKTKISPPKERRSSELISLTDADWKRISFLSVLRMRNEGCGSHFRCLRHFKTRNSFRKERNTTSLLLDVVLNRK